jgi:hypothetical protein
MREPLLHFLVLGAVLFIADYLVVSRKDDPSVIVIDAAVDEEARRVFREARGREPNEDELYALRRVWLDNEVMYREGIALGLDKGDKTIHDRVVFKVLNIIDSELRLPPFDDEVLREWFEKNRSKYDEPARYDFQEAVLSGTPSDDGVRAFVDRLNNGTPGDAGAGLRVFRGRPLGSVVESYGDEFARALEAAPTGQWRALPTSGGLRAIALLAVTQAKPATYEDLRGVVLQDWKDAVAAEQRAAAVRRLAEKYRIEVRAMTP